MAGFIRSSSVGPFDRGRSGAATRSRKSSLPAAPSKALRGAKDRALICRVGQAKHSPTILAITGWWDRASLVPPYGLSPFSAAFAGRGEEDALIHPKHVPRPRIAPPRLSTAMIRNWVAWAAAGAAQPRWNTPSKSGNSPANPAVNGRAMLDSVSTIAKHASTGIRLARSPKSPISRVWNRS